MKYILGRCDGLGYWDYLCRLDRSLSTGLTLTIDPADAMAWDSTRDASAWLAAQHYQIRDRLAGFSTIGLEARR